MKNDGPTSLSMKLAGLFIICILIKRKLCMYLKFRFTEIDQTLSVVKGLDKHTYPNKDVKFKHSFQILKLAKMLNLNLLFLILSN